MEKEEIEKMNKNTEINDILKEINPISQSVKKQESMIDPDDVARKAQEAFREFELKQKALHEQQQTDIPKSPNTEIEEALQKFEIKSTVEQQQKKSVEDNNFPKTARMVRLVMKLSGGLVKEEKQAEYILLGTAILFFLASGYLFFIGLRGNSHTASKISPAELEQMKQIENNQKK